MRGSRNINRLWTWRFRRREGVMGAISVTSRSWIGRVIGDLSVRVRRIEGRSESMSWKIKALS